VIARSGEFDHPTRSPARVQAALEKAAGAPTLGQAFE
jgi:hypothetical protein